MQQDNILEEGEIILEKVRKHWMVYAEDFIFHTFGCFVFMFAASYLTRNGVLSFINKDSDAFAGILLMMFVILFWISFFYAWTKEYLDVWYITDRHIIAIDQKQIFEREQAFMELARIQDVSFEKNGIFATFFGYGKLKVQSAGIEQEFIIDNVRDVEAVSHMIMELRDKKKQPLASGL